MSISERIGALCDLEGSQRKFAEKTGIPQPTVNRLVAKQSNVGSDNILAILDAYPTLSVEWLITGQGEMWKPGAPTTRETPMTETDREKMMQDIIELQKAQINMLKQAILEKAPELGKWLKLEE